MTLMQDTTPAKSAIIGPFSRWPRAKRTKRRKVIIYSGGIVSAAVFVHCVLPMLIAA